MTLSILLTLATMTTAQAAPAEWTPSTGEQAVVRALSVRHDPPSCEALRAELSDPVEGLAAIVDHVSMPPWVPLRAADCLAQDPKARPHLIRWVAQEDFAGVADVVVTRLGSLPEADARAVAVVALEGPHASLLRRRLETLALPALQPVLEPR